MNGSHRCSNSEPDAPAGATAPAFSLSHVRTFSLSHVLTLSHSRVLTFTRSHFHTLSPSHFHTFSPSRLRTLSPHPLKGGGTIARLLARRDRFLIWAVFVSLATAGWLHAQTPAPAHSLALTGNDRLLWVISEKWDGDQKAFLNWIASMDRANLTLRPLGVPAQFGQIQSLAAWEESLHLFVRIESDGTATTGHYAYARPGQQHRERRLPGDALPRALAGGSAELPGLWALVDGRTAHAVRVEWDEHQRSLETQPATAPAAESGRRPARELSISARPPELPPDRFFLIAYDGVRWRPGFEVPPDTGDMATAWLAISGQRCHLFWQNSVGDETVRCARREAESWINGPPLHFSAPLSGAVVGLLNKQLVFAALLEDESRAGLRCEPKVLAPDAHGWIDRPPLHESDGQKVLVLPKGSMVAGFGDNLALLRPADPEPQVGLWSPTDGRVVLPFTPVPFRRTHPNASTDRIQEIAYLAAVIGIVLLVYWRRRDMVTSPVLLPPGLTTADFARRGLAALIDMAPAAIVVGLIWRRALIEYSASWQEVIDAQETAPPDWWKLVWAWVTFAVIYSGWCTAFELFMSATPGKRLLGCLVVSESAERPTPLQIVIRNALRLLELFPPLSIWPFVLVILMTRNRQRVGDLLARTIVVEQVR